MGGEKIANAATEGAKKRKAESTPPDGYVCRLCSTPGHWIQVCPTKKTGTKRQRKSDHVPVPGKDPSPEDIERAKELQKIPPPKCFCGLPSRLNKVKRSKDGGESSRAIGKYFFFCSKKRDDETQCRFARPVDMELNKKKSIGERMKTKIGAKNKLGDNKKRDLSKWGNDKKAEKSKPKQICKFFAKNGSCKKGRKCEFSHDVQAKNASTKAPEKKKLSVASRDKKKEVNSSDSNSSSSDDDSHKNKRYEGRDDDASQRKNIKSTNEEKKGNDSSSSESGSGSGDSSSSSDESESD